MHCCLNSGWPKHGSVKVSGGDAAMALVTFFIVAADAEQVLGPAHRTTTIQQTQQNTKKQSSLVVSVSAWRCRGSLLSLGTHPPAHACSSARFFKGGRKRDLWTPKKGSLLALHIPLTVTESNCFVQGGLIRKFALQNNLLLLTRLPTVE